MLEESITEFAERVRSLVDAVNTLQNSSFQKVLYLVFIDGLSSHRFPDHHNSGDRFVRFVSAYGEWLDSVRVSLPQADLWLREAQSKDQALVSAVLNRLAQWREGTFYDLGVDPLPDELPDSTDILRDCQHVRLLWALRNTLLHEFRHPGDAFDGLSPGRIAPYYHHVSFVEGPLAGQSGWELAIPAGFLRRLTLSCLKGLTAWFRSEHKDPLLIGYQGRSWVARFRRLNRHAGESGA